MSRRHNSKTEEQHKQFAKSISEGKSIKESMLDAGYSEKQARKGRAALSKPMLEALGPELKKFEELGKSITPEQGRNIVMGRVAFNVVNGVDSGVQSAKLMGSEKSINMFQADNQVGIILQMPKTPLPKIEAHILPELDE